MLRKIKMLRKVMLLFFVLSLSLVFMGVDGCDKQTSADKEQAAKTALAMSEAQRMVGMPNIVNFQQRKLLKMIYELCDKENLICYAYIKSDYQGKLFFLGKCIGYGLPFSAQFTNPEKVVQDYSQSFGTLPQADPNGLFMPTSSSATWLIMIDPNTNEPRPVYVEPEITVSPFMLPYAIGNPMK
jgi:hypothetical protein